MFVCVLNLCVCVLCICVCMFLCVCEIEVATDTLRVTWLSNGLFYRSPYVSYYMEDIQPIITN